MKKQLSMLMFFVILCTSITAMAGDVTIKLDGTAISFPDAKPFIDSNGRTQIPIGALAEILDVKTDWDNETQTAVITKEKSALEITIGEDEIYSVQLGTTIKMDTTAILLDDRTFIPIRYVADFFDFSIEWDGEENSVNLISENIKTDESFDFKLLSYMPKDKNYMLSPFSLKMAMSMAANGAKTETKQEILDVFGIEDLDVFNNYAKNFIEEKNESVEFNVANSIWYNTDYYDDSELGFSQNYKSIIENYFNGSAEEINNKNGAEKINDWVALQTNDKINNIVTDDNIKDCISFLVNTIYFKGDWASPFNEKLTGEDLFTDRDGNQKSSVFMKNTGYYNYFENDDFQVLEKPYKGYETKMYFVLPKADKTITESDFDTAVNNMRSCYVDFKLPKFTTEYLHESKELIDMLKSMGIKTAFDLHHANFSPMYSKLPPENIYINLILQKTFISVNENGTEAAAATVIGGAGSGAIPPQPIEFKCDKPFTYIIKNDRTGDILFMGEYAFAE